MGKGLRTGGGGGSRSAFKDKAKTRVADLQGMFSDLQSARRESRAGDAAVLEEQVHQMLREWKAELNEASPASSLLGNNSHGDSDLSSEIRRLLQIGEEEDDATSKLDELVSVNPKPEPEPVDVAGAAAGGTVLYQEDYYGNQELASHGFLNTEEYKSTLPTGAEHAVTDCLEGTTHLDYQQFNLHQELPHNHYLGFNAGGQDGGNVLSHMSDLIPAICPPPSAFLRPKCALWDCPRPAQGSEWCQDYCSSFHADLALNEGPPGKAPVARPGGIDLKDGPLFAAVTAKTQGKSVGIPVCEGAATAKSPWNAPELFDLSILEGESLREWLFFDKPRRAFESGNRKQRSLPDYNGRGWHESRKQVLKEYGGLKRSYYMDPQPLSDFEWHLFEYEITSCDSCALYRLELKLFDPKKSAKAKLSCDSLVDLQQQMGRLNADNVMLENKRNVKGRSKANRGKDITESSYTAADLANRHESGSNAYHASDQIGATSDNVVYGPSLPYGYTVESLNSYYGT